MKRFIQITMLFVLVLVFIAPSPAADSEKIDLTRMRDQIRVLESVLNQNLNQNFPGPFAYLDSAQGAYLPGYGVIFSFELNLSQSPAAGPFGGGRPASAAARRDEENKRREQAKQMAERVLADFGHSIDQLSPAESLGIVIHCSAVDEHGLQKSTVIVLAQKRDIDDFRSSKLDRTAFVSKLQVVEY